MADTTEKTIADELRKAAALLRETAIAAIAGPWASLDGGDRLVAWRPDDDFEYVVEEPIDGATAEWMALANPLLAEPLASWLESAARVAREHPQDPEYAGLPDTRFCTTCQDEETTCVAFVAGALAVARVLNGATS